MTKESRPLQTMIDQKQLENVEYFIHLGSMITNEMKSVYVAILSYAAAS
jgi:hypothetical protein